MSARNRLPPWHERLRLANGREILIRPIRADDAGPLRASFPLLQPEEVRQRFQHRVKELSDETLQRLTQPQPKTEFALVAAEPLPPGEALVGAVARAAIAPGTRDAEFAILVSHYVAGMGLSRNLMRRLVRWARGKMDDSLWSDVLEDTQLMLSMLDLLDYCRESVGTTGLVRVVIDLSRSSVSKTPAG